MNESMKKLLIPVAVILVCAIILAAAGAGLTAPTVDPTAELAKAAIRFCGFSVRTDKD